MLFRRGIPPDDPISDLVGHLVYPRHLSHVLVRGVRGPNSVCGHATGEHSDRMHGARRRARLIMRQIYLSLPASLQVMMNRESCVLRVKLCEVSLLPLANRSTGA